MSHDLHRNTYACISFQILDRKTSSPLQQKAFDSILHVHKVDNILFHLFAIHVLYRTAEDPTVDAESFETLRKAIYLGICYSANIGGTGTLTGTATNLILVESYT